MRTSVYRVESALRIVESGESLEYEKMQSSLTEAEQSVADLKQLAKSLKSKRWRESGKQITDYYEEALADLVVGKEAPKVEGIDQHGVDFELSEYRGKVVLLDFFADWCPHCRAMYPGERKMVAELPEDKFALLGVHCENQQKLDDLTNQGAVTWRCWADSDSGPIATQWEIEAFPTMALIDHRGVVRWFSSGRQTEESLLKMINQLLAEAGDADAQAE